MVEIRRATPADLDALIALGKRALGWEGDDRDARYFGWKHFENPFGASPMWVAIADDRIVGLRAFMRWEFVTDGTTLSVVRAVDTATDPDYQGQGIFTRLTITAIEELRAEGVAFVFNTPNSNSLPGYLKMGWEIVGTLPVAVRFTRAQSLMKLPSARVAAERWSLDAPAGEAVGDLFTEAASQRLLGSLPARPGLSTPRSLAFLHWRYGFPPLQYRAVRAGSSVEDGVAVLRRRRRGQAVEVALCDVLIPNGDGASRRSLLRRAVTAGGGDYLIRIDTDRTSHDRFVRIPRTGPVLVHRALASDDSWQLSEWSLTLGDVELF